MAVDQKLKEKLRKRREDNEKGGGDANFHYLKKGITRIRVMPTSTEGGDWAIQLTTFYLGKGIGTVVSPMTFDKPCAIMEAYEKLKSSKKEKDNALAKTISPKRKWAVVCLKKTDEKGKEVDRGGARLALLPMDVYNNMLDLFLDDDDGGDFTDRKEGYDIKIKKTGEGQFNTEYSVIKCNQSKLPEEHRKEKYDPEEFAEKIIPSYEDTEEFIKKFLSGTSESDEDDEPKKKKKKKKRSDA